MTALNDSSLEADSIERYASGAIRESRLVQDMIVGGLPCRGGRDVVVYEDGALKMGWLSTTTTVRGVTCAADGYSFFHSNGHVWNARLAQGFADDELQVPPGARCTFDVEGRLVEWREVLHEDVVVTGLACTSYVWRWRSGAPSVVCLAAPATVGGREFPRWTELVLDEKGNVLDASTYAQPPSSYKLRNFGAVVVVA